MFYSIGIQRSGYIRVIFCCIFLINLLSPAPSLLAQKLNWWNEFPGLFSQKSGLVSLQEHGILLNTGFTSSGTRNFDPNGSYLLSGLSNSSFIQKLDTASEFQAAVLFSGIGDSYLEFVDLEMRSNGNIFGFGNFNGTLTDFNPDSLFAMPFSGQNDAFLIKLDSNLKLIDLLLFQNEISSSIKATGMALDSAGNLYIGIGLYNGFILRKYDSSLQLQWSQEFDSFNATVSEGPILVNDRLIIAGNLSDSSDMDPSSSSVAQLFPIRYKDGFIASYNLDGSFDWAQQFPGSVYPSDLASDNENNIYLIGNFDDTTDFASGILIDNRIPLDANDNFILKTDPFGNTLWASTFESIGSAEVTSISVINPKEVYVSFLLNFNDSLDADPGNAVDLHYSWAGGWGYSTFGKYDEYGNLIWSRGLRHCRADDIVVDSNSTLFWTGQAGGIYFYDYDPALGPQYYYHYQFADFSILQRWDKCDTLYLTIDTSACDSFQFGSTTYYYSTHDTIDSLASSGCPMIYFLDLTIQQSDQLTIEELGCDSLLFGAKWLRNSGIYTDTFTNANGCDSIVSLTLTILPGESLDSIIACDSLTWLDGNTYTQNNDSSSVTLVNMAGCDSVVNLNLQIHHSNSSMNSLSVCDSFTWIDGNTYYNDINSLTYILTNQHGCDSTVNMDLTVEFSSASFDTIMACDSATWMNGLTYYNSTNDPIDTFVNSLGCDSLVSLNLTILNSTNAVDQINACDSITWIDGANYYSSNNTATYTLTNQAGCDSVVALNLSLDFSSSATEMISACDSFTWINGETYSTSVNNVTSILPNALGCDSLVTLDLTIDHSSSSVQYISHCDNYTWIDGMSYTASTDTAIYVIANNAGCDSTINLNLTINHSDSTSQSITACDSYAWIDGNTYTSSNNTATHILTNTAGCDSVITLDLTINQSSSGTDVIQVCDSITWIDGITYTSSNNSATYTLANAAGCDSIVTLDLTIQSTSSTDTVSSCDSYTWIDGVTYSASNNTATYVTTNAAGCDSTIYLNLTIDTVNTGVNISGTTLTAEVTEANYQWLACDSAGNFSMLPNDTNQSFTPTQNGEYALRIVKNGCKDTSECISVNNVGFNEQNPFDQVSIFPNPTLGTLNIDLGSISTAQVRVLNAVGQVIVQQTEINRSSNQVRINGAAGVYFLEVSVNGEAKRFRVVKE